MLKDKQFFPPLSLLSRLIYRYEPYPWLWSRTTVRNAGTSPLKMAPFNLESREKSSVKQCEILWQSLWKGCWLLCESSSLISPLSPLSDGVWALEPRSGSEFPLWVRVTWPTISEIINWQSKPEMFEKGLVTWNGSDLSKAFNCHEAINMANNITPARQRGWVFCRPS